MNWRNIGVVYRKELTDSLRDRRTVVAMIVVPIFLMPLLTILLGVISARLMGRAMREIPAVMVMGGEDSPQVLAALRELTGIRIVPARPDYAQEIVEKHIRAAIDIPRDFDAVLQRGETAAIQIYYYEGDLNSGLGSEKLQRFFRELRDRAIRERLSERQLSPSLAEPVRIEERNVAPPEKVAGLILGGLIPYFVILLSLTGTMYPAMDLTVGEKERGTIETILCSPISRISLVLGKFLMVLTASLSTAVLSVASMGLTVALGDQILGRLREAIGSTLQLTISPKAMVWVFVMVVPLTVFFSAALLAISLFAKSFKEAQSYISPLTIVVIVPAIVSLLPGMELNCRLSLVPILNTSLVTKEIVSGTYHWNYIALIFGSSCAYAAAALWFAIKLFQREDVLLRV
jgi:sodium transport system permease protein